MKVKLKIEKEYDVKEVKVVVAVRYGEDDIPNDFPMRQDDTWEAYIDIETGKIQYWPEGKSGRLHMKVCDEGCYYLIDRKGDLVKSIEQDYVPNGLSPGKYGDYIDLHINEQGVITNWPKHPSFEDFTQED